MEEKPDFESTTQVLARRAPGLAWLPSFLRQRLTPAALWSAVIALVVAVAWVLNALNNIRLLQESVKSLEQERDLLHKIDNSLAAMSSKVDGIAAEVDHQRQWRESIEREAESPPHPRKRR